MWQMSEQEIEDNNTMSVERISAAVVFTLRLCDHYDAIALHDKACASLEETGTFSISVNAATTAMGLLWLAQPLN